MTHGITPEQYEYLMKPLKSTRISTLERSGKRFSHLEAWDIKAHLTRIFGFCNFDIETLDVRHSFTREYESNNGKPMWEVGYQATVQLTIRDQWGNQLCRFSESSVDSQSGGTGLGDLHDNAIKAATSGALKRCATSLGTQFGLSLYDDGRRDDVVRITLVHPEGVETDTSQEGTGDDLTDAQTKVLTDSLGAEFIHEDTDSDDVVIHANTVRKVEDHELPDDGLAETPNEAELVDGEVRRAPEFERKIDTTEAAKAAIEAMSERANR